MAEKAPSKVPAGMHSITPQLYFNGNCKDAIEYYKKVFSAQQLGETMVGPDEKTVSHALLKIGDSQLMVADFMPGSNEPGSKQSNAMEIWLYVEDCDATYNQAIKAGAEVLFEMDDMFWGDRMGKVKDPYGHTWNIASNLWAMTNDEVKKKQDEFMKNYKEK
jgi:PhnB protein